MTDLNPKNLRYRITHPDAYNWCIEEWQEGGEINTRGRGAGKPKRSCWKQPEFFYSSLRHAALGMLEMAAGDALASGEAQNILDALTLAEARVTASLTEFKQ